MLRKPCGPAPVSPPGLVIRKQALIDRGLDLPQLIDGLGPLDVRGETADLVSIGPLFGAEAVLAAIRAFETRGLVYVDDFYAVEIDLPDWLRLDARLADAQD